MPFRRLQKDGLIGSYGSSAALGRRGADGHGRGSAVSIRQASRSINRSRRNSQVVRDVLGERTATEQTGPTEVDRVRSRREGGEQQVEPVRHCRGIAVG